MNDATELESSLTGAIDFFQNLRRKLGVLETDADAQHNQMHMFSGALATLEQDRKADRQTLANLSGGLVKVQADGRLLEQQLNAVETQVASFQQDQQQMRQTLAAVADDLRAQGVAWRQELEATLTPGLAPMDKVVALEQTVRTNQEQFEQVSTAIGAQYKRLLQFDITLENLDQNSRSLNQALGALKTDFERHERTLSAFEKTAGTDEVARRQLQTQQERLDALTASSTVAEQNLQATRQDIAHIKGELETQRRVQADVAQTRQELQKHQDRLKHLETLMGKVSADTNSTRQILNVIQTDLATQNDTLHELDQNWRDSLLTYQDRLSSVEIIIAGADARPTALLAEASSPFPTPPEPASVAPVDHQLDHQPLPAVEYERLTALETAWATARDQHDTRFEALEAAFANTLEQHQALARELSAIQTTLGHQDERFAELRDTLSGPWDAVQQRLSELETTLEHLRQSLEADATTDTDPSAIFDSLRQAIAEQSADLEETQQLAWSQIQDLQQRLSEAEAALDSVPPPAEPAAAVSAEADAIFASLRQAIAEQSADLEETQQLAWSQIQDLQQRLSEAEAALDSVPPPAEPVAAVSAASDAVLASLREDLLAQVETLNEFQGITRQQFTDLTAALNAQQQDFHGTAQQIADLQQEVRQLQQQPAPDQTMDPQRLEAAELHAQEVRQDLDALREAVTALETRMSSQSQAFSGNFEQFRSLNADIHVLQQQITRLDASPRQLGAFEQELATHEQEINQLKEIIEQIQADSQHMGDALQQRSDSPLTEVAARLDEQRERWAELAAIVETLRADSKASQETVVTMATNVAKRIHEIQNLLVATENTQSERLQEVEQKLIQMQAAFETLENQRKPRKWFSMPASITAVMLAVGVSGLAILAHAIWNIA